MISSRIADLMRRIEAGDTITQKDVDRIADLQTLDIAKAGEDFVREAVARDAAHTALFRQLTEGP